MPSKPALSNIQKIEAAFDLILVEEDSSKKYHNSYYQYYGDIRGLRIFNTKIKDFYGLYCIAQTLERLTLINCVIEDMSSIAILKRVQHLTLDGCELKVKDGNLEIADTIKRNFQYLQIENMEVKHLSALRPISQNIDYIEFRNCKIHNFYEVNLLPTAPRLSFDQSEVIFTEKDILHKKVSEREIIALIFSNMHIERLEDFFPVAKGLRSLTFKNTHLDSLECILSMPAFSLLCIDTATTVREQKISALPRIYLDEKLECEILQVDEDIDPDKNRNFDLKKLASIAPFIQQISFDDTRLKNKGFFKEFKRLKALEFGASKLDLKQFLALASQIQKLKLVGTTLKNLKYLKDYTALTEIDTDEKNIDGKVYRPIRNLKRLLPLKDRLKKLLTWEENLKGLQYIGEFTALESLRTTEYISEKTAHIIFQLPNLRKLDISLKAKNGTIFNLKALTKLEGLSIFSGKKIVLEGLEHLKNLKYLSLEGSRLKVKGIDQLPKLEYLGCNAANNINKIGEMKSLKFLVLDIDWDFKIKGLEQFPNLEKLSISGGDKNSTIGYLPNLKVFSPSTGEKPHDIYKGLPNLEELDLEYNYLEELPDFSSLSKLKVLNLSENHDLSNIEGLRHLKSLKQLNLYDTNIKDLSVLNTLEHLKEVNLCGIGISYEEGKKQLDKPEIATHLGRPFIPFFIRRDQSLEM
jgi:Leucine-rich repeat (LRR) protein